MNSKGRHILHITAHLGGGVGRVLLNYLAAVKNGPDRHHLLCLDYANEAARTRAAAEGLELGDRCAEDWPTLFRAVAEADLVILHWWNHPLSYALLAAGPWPPARLLLWSHVSGRRAPQIITRDLLNFPDIFLAASPVTLKLPVFNDFSGRADLVFSCAGLEHVEGLEPQTHDGFRVGYLGTVDYVKMHPDFLKLCLAADIPQAVFAVAGGPEDERLRAEAAAIGATDRFEILGQISNIRAFLSSLDVFGYPLNPDHYGTGEQALIEAQAAGLPAVVLSGGAEEQVIEPGQSGLAAADAEDYGRCLRLLYENPVLRAEMSAAARLRARERFDIESTIKAFERIFDQALQKPKWSRASWPHQSPADLFLSSQGEEAAFFENMDQAPLENLDIKSLSLAALSPSRGSVFHYASFFPGDRRLQAWAKKIKTLMEQ